MSELYFENVIEKGNLYLDHILYEFEDEPILFLAKTKMETDTCAIVQRSGENEDGY